MNEKHIHWEVSSAIKLIKKIQNKLKEKNSIGFQKKRKIFINNKNRVKTLLQMFFFFVFRFIL